jgi:site-specific DNA recombinase
MRQLVSNVVYFTYVRKSTDVEDKQVLSVEAQMVELRKFARDNNLQVAGVIIEKKSAKTPGRPKFNKMLERIQAGEANGILSWHPDRLARNSIDGGQIVYLLDQTHLQSLKFPTFWFENTSQGKFMLSIAFGQSKYYIDNLAENTKRGLRQKIRRGEFPGLAPVGYINDVRVHIIVVDKRRAPLVAQAFKLYSVGDKRLVDIADFLASKGIKTSGGLPLKKDQIKKMLTNPIYYGHFRYAGEVYEGKHVPIISKKLFDRVQATLEQRGHKRKGANEPQALCGLLVCGRCGMAITAEKKVKHQKNGNVHEYIYYRCSRKHKMIVCKEPTITEPLLVAQLSDMLQSYALPKSWAQELETLLTRDEQKAEQDSSVYIANSQVKVAGLQVKLKRLLDSYLDQDIDQSTYRAKQAELMSEKKTIEEQIGTLTITDRAWVEPLREWLKQASDLNTIAKTAEPREMKQAFLKMDGLNLFLKDKKARLQPCAKSHSPQENIWLALRASKQKAARWGDNSEKSLFLAEREGFEPSVPFPARRFSRPLPSTTRSPLRIKSYYSRLLLTPTDVVQPRLHQYVLHHTHVTFWLQPQLLHQ